MRPYRLFLALVVAAGLAPGIVVRAPIPALPGRSPIVITELAGAWRASGPVVLERAWIFVNPQAQFGGFSSLLSRGDGSLLAPSDGGELMTIRLDHAAPAEAYLDRFVRRFGLDGRPNYDLESITRDPRSGSIWIASEQNNRITRYDQDLQEVASAAPPAMSGWSANGGPEASARLSDGSFLVMSEYTQRQFSSAHAGLRFASDPTDPRTPSPDRFTVELPDGFSPVDMAQLPDGRVLILLRQLTFPFPPSFASALAIADPADIRADAPWRARLLTRFPEDWPSDNYEGLAIDPLPGGAVRLWVIADDNRMQRFQQTKLLRLHLRLEGGRNTQGARSPAARP